MKPNTKASHWVVNSEVLGVNTAFHIVEQPITRSGELWMTISVQMPALRFRDGVLRVFPNPKNKPA